MSDYLGRMAAISREAHEGQTRRGSNDAYANHPSRVADEARAAGLSVEAQAAAFLHDVVEDCAGWTYERLADRGATPRTIALVRLLTKEWCALGLGNGGRAGPAAHEIARQRKVGYYADILTDNDAVALKLLDRADNLVEIAEWFVHHESWGRSYLRKTAREFGPLATACTNNYARFRLAAAVAKLAAVARWNPPA